MHLLPSTNGRLHTAPRIGGTALPAPATPPRKLCATFDPYAPIEKVPLVSADLQSGSRAFSVRVEDDHEPSGWREAGVVRSDYLLVPNRDVRDLGEEIALRSGYAFQTVRTVFDGRRYALAISFATAPTSEVKVGDAVSLGLLMRNSYDGSQRLSASLYVNRLVCANGMLAPQMFGMLRFKHLLTSSGWEDEVRQTIGVIQAASTGLQAFAQAAQRLASARLSHAHLKALRSGPLAALPVGLWGKIVDRTALHEEASLWGLMNGGTYALWHMDRMSVTDLGHNETLTRGLLSYAAEL